MGKCRICRRKQDLNFMLDITQRPNRWIDILRMKNVRRWNLCENCMRGVLWFLDKRVDEINKKNEKICSLCLKAIPRDKGHIDLHQIGVPKSETFCSVKCHMAFMKDKTKPQKERKK